MKYKDSLVNITGLIGSYKEVREIGDVDNIQELRDRLSEELFHFGEEFAQIRANAEKAESDYKMCIEKGMKKWRDEFAGTKVTAATIENHAKIDCETLLDELNERRKEYYLAKELIERTDQVLNSLSSRLKLILKND